MAHFIVIVVAFVVGIGAHYFTKKNDSCLEQIAEQILKSENIDVDFSAPDKEKEAKEAQKDKQ